MTPWPARLLQPATETTLGAARHSSLLRPPAMGIEGYRATWMVEGGIFVGRSSMGQARPIGIAFIPFWTVSLLFA